MELRSGPDARVWILAETDYRFGGGELRIIIDSVDWSRPQILEGETWYDVRGTEITADGRVIGARQTMVKAGRLNAGR